MVSSQFTPTTPHKCLRGVRCYVSLIITRTLLAAVHELAGVHAFASDEQLLDQLVPVGIAERHEGERSTAARIVHDFLKSTQKRFEGAAVEKTGERLAWDVEELRVFVP
jgi:hypothetical protein